MNSFFQFLNTIDSFIWEYAGVAGLVILGVYFTVVSRFYQIRKFGSIVRLFIRFFKEEEHIERGVHPLKVFFASIGGTIGIGNIIGVCTAVQIGGPGALVWIWLTALAGMLMKYCEIYLGMKYRVDLPCGGYHGGPMYYLRKVPGGKFLAIFASIFLCIYGVEVFIFRVITESFVVNFDIDRYLTALVFLPMVLFAGAGGVKRVGEICSMLIPVFLSLFGGMTFYVLWQNAERIPIELMNVIHYAFTPHAAVGGFAGSTILMTVSQGVKNACYTADIGIGYASVIHSESSSTEPQDQASMGIFGIFLDTFVVCTMSILLVLVTEVWKEPMDSSLLVQAALTKHFPHMNIFMPIFIFLLGYSTIIAYFCVGLNCAEYLAPRWGKVIYYIYSICALLIFSIIGTAEARMIMSLSGGMLLLMNAYGFFFLRKDVKFD